MMAGVPQVSVVMGVFNGAADLEKTIGSVMSQEGVALEFIVVDDGSTDVTADLLTAWVQRDSRLRVISQANRGLTAALIAGCQAARGEYIARQDCGDVSLPGRFATQAAILQARPEVVLVSAATRFVGPCGESLYVVRKDGVALQQGLLVRAVGRLSGPPHHGSTMFRRESYVTAGGYREQFVVAQDIDLWLRLAEVGTCYGLEDLLYEAVVAPGSISSRRRDEQFKLAQLAIDCAIDREKLGSDRSRLSSNQTGLSVRRRSAASPLNRSLELAKYYYFIGGCLANQDRANARKYFSAAWRTHPMMVRALLRAIWT